MNKIRKAAAALAATGLMTFGAVAASGGIAKADTGVAITACDAAGSRIVSVSGVANCTAGTSTIQAPTSLTVSVDPSFFTTLLGNTLINALLGGVLSATVTYNLTCVVDGHAATSSDTGFVVNSASDNTHTINLQSAVGSPAPTSCTLANLKVSSLIAAGILTEVTAILHLNLSFGVSATGDTGVPGAIFTQAAANSAGAVPAICADDTANANHGTVIQAYTCESDLADNWLQVVTNQFVHNGDCLDNVAGTAELSLCAANPGSSNSQVWTSVAKPLGFVELVNTGDSECLTVSSPADGTPLTLTHCTGAADQLFKVPGVTPV